MLTRTVLIYIALSALNLVACAALTLATVGPSLPAFAAFWAASGALRPLRLMLAAWYA